MADSRIRAMGFGIMRFPPEPSRERLSKFQPVQITGSNFSRLINSMVALALNPASIINRVKDRDKGQGTDEGMSNDAAHGPPRSDIHEKGLPELQRKKPVVWR